MLFLSPQAQYLRDLNRSGQHDAVIQLFEAERLANTEEVFGQYVRALAKADKLNGTALMQTLYRGAQSYMGAGAGAAAAGAARAMDAGAGGSFAASALRPAAFALPGALGSTVAPAAAAAGGSEAALGSAKNPLFMMQAEPTFWSQLWRRWAEQSGGWLVAHLMQLVCTLQAGGSDGQCLALAAPLPPALPWLMVLWAYADLTAFRPFAALRPAACACWAWPSC